MLRENPASVHEILPTKRVSCRVLFHKSHTHTESCAHLREIHSTLLVFPDCFRVTLLHRTRIRMRTKLVTSAHVLPSSDDLEETCRNMLRLCLVGSLCNRAKCNFPASDRCRSPDTRTGATCTQRRSSFRTPLKRADSTCRDSSPLE